MYAVIRTGGKQYRVTPGEQLRVEKMAEGEASLTPLLVVDGDAVTTDASMLAGMPVVVKVVSEGRGKKIKAGKYKNKTRYRRRWGHRQDFHLVSIESIAGVAAETQPVVDKPVDVDVKPDETDETEVTDEVSRAEPDEQAADDNNDDDEEATA